MCARACGRTGHCVCVQPRACVSMLCVGTAAHVYTLHVCTCGTVHTLTCVFSVCMRLESMVTLQVCSRPRGDRCRLRTCIRVCLCVTTWGVACATTGHGPPIHTQGRQATMRREDPLAIREPHWHRRAASQEGQTSPGEGPGHTERSDVLGFLPPEKFLGKRTGGANSPSVLGGLQAQRPCSPSSPPLRLVSLPVDT